MDLDDDLEARGALARGVDHRVNARYAAALGEFRRALATFERLGDAGNAAVARVAIGDVLLQLGRFEDARVSYETALRDQRIDPTMKLVAEAGLLAAQMELGLEIALPWGADLEATDEADVPAALAAKDRGDELARQGLHSAAIAEYRNAAEEYERRLLATDAGDVARGGRLVDLAIVHQRLAQAHHALGDEDGAIEHVRQQIRWQRQIHQDTRIGLDAAPLLSGSLHLLGTLSALRNDLAGAESALREALEVAEPLDLPQLWQIDHGLARLAQATARHRESDRFYRRSLARIERLRADLVTDETKIGFLTFKVQPFDDYVRFLLDERPEPGFALKALVVTEQARARATLEMLNRDDHPLADGPHPTRPTRIETPSPVRVASSTAEEIVALARGGEATFVVFFVSAEATYVWWVPPTGEISWREIAVRREDLARRVGAFRREIEKGAGENEGRELYELLLAPAMRAIDVPSTGLRLTLVPHDVLNGLPFAALRDGDGWWGLRHELTLLPSLSVAAHLETPVYAPEDRALLVGRPTGLPQLSQSEAEVGAVAALFAGRSRILLGDDADVAHIVAEAGDHPYILFSTHGQTFPRDPRRSHLLFAHHERLTMVDILRLRLDAKLVVLSACETHAGPLRAGDELMSLTRAFLVGGAAQVLTTLWRVSEAAAVAIVTRFFTYLVDGKRPALALVMAQRDLEARAHGARSARAFAWAPFVLVGRN